MVAGLLSVALQRLPMGIIVFLWNLWGPFRGAGIKITYISPDFLRVKVEMKLRWFNVNYVGTQFGGSLYAMTDPFYMLILLENLGSNYIVWDKAASIEFKKPGRGTVYIDVSLTQEQIAEIKAKADSQEKYIFDLPIQILNDAQEVIAEVSKTLYVRKKSQ